MRSPLWLRRLGCAIFGHRVFIGTKRSVGCARCDAVIRLDRYAERPAPPRNQPLNTPADIRRVWEVERARERVRQQRPSQFSPGGDYEAIDRAFSQPVAAAEFFPSASDSCGTSDGGGCGGGD